jgi:hypothetical protein
MGTPHTKELMPDIISEKSIWYILLISTFNNKINAAKIVNKFDSCLFVTKKEEKILQRFFS